MIDDLVEIATVASLLRNDQKWIPASAGMTGGCAGMTPNQIRQGIGPIGTGQAGREKSF